MAPIITVKNLSKNYDYYKKQPGLGGAIKNLFKREKLSAEAVKSISFNIEQGELVGFLGPNGAGKTTTLKMLAGIMHPTNGEAKVMEYTPWLRQVAYQKQFAIVMGQRNQLWWDLPARESFILNKEIYEIPKKEYEMTLAYLSEILDLKDILNIQVRKLSLGQRMKCELTAALLHSPKILFLDEPTIGLDVVSQKKIRDFIKYYNEVRKTTVLLTSHYMADVEQLCERIIIIDLGKIIYDGKLKDLSEKYAGYNNITVVFTKKVMEDDLKEYGKLVEYDGTRALIEVPKKYVKECAVKILSVLPVEDILISEVKIEDLIRNIFDKNYKL